MDRHYQHYCPGKGVLCLGCIKRLHIRVFDRRLPAVLLLLVHCSTCILHAHPLCYIPSKRLPLLPCGFVLLRQPPRTPNNLGISKVETAVHRHILSGLRQQCCSNCHVAEQPGLPFAGQSHFAIHSHHATSRIALHGASHACTHTGRVFPGSLQYKVLASREQRALLAMGNASMGNSSIRCLAALLSFLHHR